MKSHSSVWNFGWLSECRNELYGLAIIWVVFFHGYDWNNFDYSFGIKALRPLQDFAYLGNCGVDIFLLLSGICLYFSFSKRQEMLPFYKKRFQRLFPPFWIINTLYWLYLVYRDVFLLNGSALKAGGKFIMRMSGLSFWFGSDLQVWYISFIAVLYLAYPMIYHYFFSQDENKIWAKLVFWVSLIVLLLMAARRGYPKAFGNVEIALTRIPAFLIGCAVGKLVYEKKEIPLKWLWIFPVLLAGVFGVFAFDLIPLLKAGGLWRYTLLILSCAFAVFSCWLLHYWKWKPIHVFLQFFGSISLELYLAHCTLRRVFIAILDRDVIGMRYYVPVVALSVLLAYGVHLLENRLFAPKKVVA